MRARPKHAQATSSMPKIEDKGDNLSVTEASLAHGSSKFAGKHRDLQLKFKVGDSSDDDQDGSHSDGSQLSSHIEGTLSKAAKTSDGQTVHTDGQNKL